MREDKSLNGESGVVIKIYDKDEKGVDSFIRFW